VGNEYFRNDAEGQNKAAEWIGYIFPIPLVLKSVKLVKMD